MAIKVIHPERPYYYARAGIKVPMGAHFLSWGLSGVMPLSPSGVNAKYNQSDSPFSLGSGVYVDTVGRYLMSPAYQPVAQFLVVNNGPDTIYAGVNSPASGQWGLASGLAIPSGASFEFGAEYGSQVIRDVWAMTSTGQSVVYGYATNILG